MKERLLVVLTGAGGLVLAALFYFVALDLRGYLSGMLAQPDLELLIFLIFLAVSLLEVGVMIFVLMQFARQLPLPILGIVVAGYVSVAGLYAVAYALLVKDEPGIQALAGLAVVRWVTLWFVPME